MLPRFFNSEVKIQPQSRFQERVESKKIVGLIEKLRTKVYELKNSADDLGPDSLDYAKYKILSRLLFNFDHSIDDFNIKSSPSDSIGESQDYINLLRELAEYIKEINQNRDRKDILSQFRNKDRDRARSALNVGVWGAVGVAFVFSTLVAGASAFLVGSSVETIVDSRTDLNNPLTQTCVLLNQLLHTLDLTIKNLILVINLKQVDYDKINLSDEDNMVCPITRELMDDPVVCVLDGYSYEKDALTKWLAQHRTSPMTRKPMKQEANVEDVMIQNRGLKHLIDNYKLYKQQVAVHHDIETKTMVMIK